MSSNLITNIVVYFEVIRQTVLIVVSLLVVVVLIIDFIVGFNQQYSKLEYMLLKPAGDNWIYHLFETKKTKSRNFK